MPVQSKSTVVAADKDVAPVPPKDKVAVPSVSDKAFTEVKVIARALRFVAVEEELPIVIVLAEEEFPISIA